MLKRIEIQGFKSFTERTILTFDSPLNGIVGPNGSGKSNVVDAIKWCLGEQALSHIRCKNALDVIFAGSESKPPSNYCEVSVTFDNTAGVFPIDFQEVEVTRKLYRSGESEYYLNRAPCRLKDIRDLMLDTGLASNGYAIIPQGKVEFIVSAKAEERRLLFEETAGVAKFKAHREESLRKLERVKLDMARVEDILAYLRDQMSALESAVRKAKNYQKYRDELQVLECAHIVQTVRALDERLSRARAELDTVTAGYAAAVNELAEGEARVVECKGGISDLEKQYLELKDQLAAAETEVQLASQRIENYKKEIADAETGIGRARAEIATLESSISQQVALRDECRIRREELLESLRRVAQEKQAHQHEYDALKERISVQQTLIRERNNRLTELLFKRTGLQSEMSFSSKQLQTAAVESGALRRDAENNARTMETVRVDLADLAARAESLATERAAAAERLATASAEIEAVTREIAATNTALEELNREFYSLSSRLDSINRAMSAQPYSVQKVDAFVARLGNPRIHGPIKNLVRIAAEHYPLLVSNLGNRLHWFIAETEADALAAIEALAAGNVGYATFIIADRLEDSPTGSLGALPVSFEERWRPVMTHLFAGMSVEHALVRCGAAVHGGQFVADEAQEDVYWMENRVTELDALIAASRVRLDELNERAQRCLSEKVTMENRVIAADADLGEVARRREEKQEYLATLEQLAATLELQLAKYTESSAQLEQAVTVLSADLGRCDTEEKVLRDEINAMSEELSRLQSSGIMDSFLRITSEHTKLEEQANSIAHEIAAKEELIASSRARIAAVREDIARLEGVIHDTRERVIQGDRELGDLLQRRSEVQSRATDVNLALENRRTELAAMEQRVHELLARKDELQARRQSLELQVNSDDAARTAQEQRLMEKYSLGIEDARAAYASVEVDVQQMERLRKRLESMGPINLAAPEEYAQLEEKYNALVAQQQDLIKSQEDIAQAIAKISGQITANFRETFRKVRESFQKLIGLLFEGGTADLVLTNEDNLLETGVEITVQPPGKRLQNINLLSGGEKSLVAIALLFAFFMVRPSPVCILDEADAPLDEANILRFMKLLQEFTTSTKFLLITHHTRTMEHLDSIYGVTMEELGVSKIISMKLQRQEAAATA
jgi:chromosome segregation protein